MHNKLQKLQSKVVEAILVVVSLVLGVVLVIPAIFLAAAPFLLWRCIIILWTKIARKDIVKIMDGMDPVFAVDDMYDRPLSTIVGMIAFENGMTYDDVISIIEKALEDKNANGELLHTEFRSYYFRRLGYLWWKREENFDKYKHITFWNSGIDPDRVISENEFIDIVSALESKPFIKDQSPWEVVMVKNCMLKNVQNPEKPKFLVIFRVHHGLADGMTMLYTFMRYFSGESMDTVAKPTTKNRNSVQTAMYTATAILHIPYQFFRQCFSAWDKNEWHLPEEKLSRVMHKAWSDRISTQVLREIKTRHRVCFTAVLIASITGALRTMMIRQNVPLPQKLHALLPFPWPNRPKTVGNHWSYVFATLPVAESDPHRRLRKINANIDQLKKSPSPYVNFAILDMFNLLPAWIIERTTVSSYLPTVTISNFPGPPSLSTVGQHGHQLVDAMFTVGPMRGNIGIVVDILSYNGGIRIVTGVDSSILPHKPLVQEFAQEMQHQIFSLQREDIV